LTLVDLGQDFDRSKLVLFDPQLDFDTYVKILEETHKFVRKIYDERWKLIKSQSIGETVEAVVASKGKDDVEFKSIMESADRAIAPASRGGPAIRFGVGLTASTLLSSIPQIEVLVTALAELAAKYTGFSSPLLNPMIKYSLGFPFTELAKKRIVGAFDKVMKKPWAKLYFTVHRRDLPSTLRVAMRDIWYVSRERKRTPQLQSISETGL